MSKRIKQKRGSLTSGCMPVQKVRVTFKYMNISCEQNLIYACLCYIDNFRIFNQEKPSEENCLKKLEKTDDN